MAKKTVTAWVGVDNYNYVICVSDYRSEVRRHLFKIFGPDLVKRRRNKTIRVVKAKITWEDK